MTSLIKYPVRLARAVLANLIYRFPARRLRVIGVTGTDGKTTTTSLIYHILKSAGHKTVMVTTVGAYINDQQRETGFHVTTPTVFALQKFLREAVNMQQEFAVIETSSHGIDQNRVWGIPYEVAAITNITHEHLDYHKTFEAYAGTKFKFLKSAKTSVINIDDPSIAEFKPKLTNKVLTYSLSNPANFNLEIFPFQSNLFGTFNQSNALAAIAACKSVGISDEDIRAALASFKAPAGRQDIVWNKDFKVMVDFAHTPNSIENLLHEAKKTNPARLVHLFGAPGRRDVAKRPLMGQASSKFADIIIIAPDDPRDEKVSDINEQIKQGISSNFKLGQNLFEFQDRMEAVKFALKKAQPGDFIVLTGKGHEPTLALADREMPWNEREIALRILSEQTPD